MGIPDLHLVEEQRWLVLVGPVEKLVRPFLELHSLL
jgi:hypothetical protein